MPLGMPLLAPLCPLALSITLSHAHVHGNTQNSLRGRKGIVSLPASVTNSAFSYQFQGRISSLIASQNSPPDPPLQPRPAKQSHSVLEYKLQRIAASQSVRTESSTGVPAPETNCTLSWMPLQRSERETV